MKKVIVLTVIVFFILGMVFMSGCEKKEKTLQKEKKEVDVKEAKRIAERRRVMEEKKKAEEKRIADWEKITACPKTNKISKFTSTSSVFKAIQPLDLSKPLYSSAGTNKAGTLLQVIMTYDISPSDKKTDSSVTPKKEKSKWTVGAVVNFTNAGKLVVKGIYKASPGNRKPFMATAEVRIFRGKRNNTLSSLRVEKGTAEIIAMTDTNVCGKFNLQSKNGKNVIKGTFNLEIERSKW